MYTIRYYPSDTEVLTVDTLVNALRFVVGKVKAPDTTTLDFGPPTPIVDSWRVLRGTTSILSTSQGALLAPNPEGLSEIERSALEYLLGIVLYTPKELPSGIGV